MSIARYMIQTYKSYDLLQQSKYLIYDFLCYQLTYIIKFNMNM